MAVLPASESSGAAAPATQGGRRARFDAPVFPLVSAPVSSLYPRAAVTAVVLAGGRGARMGGADKGLVEVAGRPMIEHVLDALAPQAGAILINANRNAERYAGYGHAVLADGHEGFQGPLAGMASALEAAATEFVLIAPCDSPLVGGELGARLHAGLVAGADGNGPADIAVAHDGERMHPVFVLVRRAATLPGLRAFLARGERKIDRWFAEESTVAVDLSDAPEMFLNVNREEDLARLEQHLRGAGEGDADAIALHARDGRRIPVVGLAGYHNSGKTTLAVGLVRALTGAGLRVAVVKHAHHSFDLDQPGKDSHTLRREGAAQTLIGSRRRWALITELGEEAPAPGLEELLARLDPDAIDLVLVEGFKRVARLPKIAVARAPDTSLPDAPHIIAVATLGVDDASGSAPDVPRLDLNAPPEVAHFIRERFGI